MRDGRSAKKRGIKLKFHNEVIQPCQTCKGTIQYIARGLRKTFRKNRYGQTAHARGFFFVACLGCSTRGEYRSTKKLAVAAWNSGKVRGW